MRDTFDEIERGRATERAVEIDEVEAKRALIAEPTSELDGISALYGDGLTASLGEPDDAPFEDIDCGNHVELLC